jgi:putative membrane protein
MFPILLLKGFLIGIAFIIPGLSGGTMAIYLGIYQPMLEAIGSLFQNFKKNFLYLLPIGIGLIISIVLFAGIVGWLLDVNSAATLFLFIGLMIGGLPKLTKSIHLKQTHPLGFVLSVVAFLLVAFLFIGNLMSSGDAVTTIPVSVGNALLLFVLGAAAATTMIVPGVSGSALLVVLGFYTAIVTNVVGNVFDFAVFGYNVYVLACFALGAVTGIYLASKILNRLLTNYPSESMLVIVGFLLASVGVLFLEIRQPATGVDFQNQAPIYRDYLAFIRTEWVSLIASAMTFTMGFIASKKLIALSEPK